MKLDFTLKIGWLGNSEKFGIWFLHTNSPGHDMLTEKLVVLQTMQKVDTVT